MEGTHTIDDIVSRMTQEIDRKNRVRMSKNSAKHWRRTRRQMKACMDHLQCQRQETGPLLNVELLTSQNRRVIQRFMDTETKTTETKASETKTTETKATETKASETKSSSGGSSSAVVDMCRKLWKRSGPLDREWVRVFRGMALKHTAGLPTTATAQQLAEQLARNVNVDVENAEALKAIIERDEPQDRAFAAHVAWPNTIDHMSARQWLHTVNCGEEGTAETWTWSHLDCL